MGCRRFPIPAAARAFMISTTTNYPKRATFLPDRAGLCPFYLLFLIGFFCFFHVCISLLKKLSHSIFPPSCFLCFLRPGQMPSSHPAGRFSFAGTGERARIRGTMIVSRIFLQFWFKNTSSRRAVAFNCPHESGGFPPVCLFLGSFLVFQNAPQQLLHLFFRSPVRHQHGRFAQ